MTSDTTPKGLLKLLVEGAQNAVTANENALWLEFALHRRVEDRDLAAPPALASGDAGKAYIVAAGASGAWAGREGELALWDGVAWLFLSPAERLAVWLDDENVWAMWDGAAWSVFGLVSQFAGRGGAVQPAAGDYDAGQIAETATAKIMTDAERTKLAGIEAGAEVNDVASVHGRTGAVVATAGDYTAAQVGFAPYGALVATDVQAAIQALEDEKAPKASPTFTGTSTWPGSTTIDTAGKLGVKVAPAYSIHIGGQNTLDVLLRSSAANKTSVHLRTDGNHSYIGNMDNFVSNGSSGNGWLYITGQAGIGFYYGSAPSKGTEAGHIDSSGNLRWGSSIATVIDAERYFAPVVKTLATLATASTKTNRKAMVSDPASGKSRSVESDGTNWRYMDGTIAV